MEEGERGLEPFRDHVESVGPFGDDGDVVRQHSRTKAFRSHQAYPGPKGERHESH